MKEVLDEYDRIFYYKEDFSDEERFKLVDESLKISIDVHVDELKAHQNPFRTSTDITLDEFKEEYKSSSWKLWRYICSKDFVHDLTKIDICQIFCRMNVEYKELDHDENGEFYWLRNKDLFLYITMPYKDGIELLKKYGLEEQR